MIEQGYFITKDSKIIHAENWYDECSSSYEFEGLHIYSNNRDLCSYGQGKNISSLDSLFRCLLSENQFNIKKLAERIGDGLKDSLDTKYRNKAIKNLDEDILKEAIYDWSTCVDIPGYVFTDKSLFAENFPPALHEAQPRHNMPVRWCDGYAEGVAQTWKEGGCGKQ